MSQQILIAEDDEDIVELLSLYLTGEGFTVFPPETDCRRWSGWKSSA